MVQETSWQKPGQEIATQSVETWTRRLSQVLEQPEALGRLLLNPRLQKFWLLGLTSLILLTLNPRLFLAIAAGGGTVKLIHKFSQSPARLTTWQQTLRHWLKRPDVIALMGGVTVMAATYTVTSLWASLDDPWLATVLIAQTLVSLTTLALVWQRPSPQPAPEPIMEPADSSTDPAVTHNPDQALLALTHPDSLKRLIAIRQLLAQVEPSEPVPATAATASVSLRVHVIDCFRVMVVQERDPIVRNALRDGLQRLAPVRPQLGEGAPPLQLSPKLAQPDEQLTVPRQCVAPPQVEYVEP